MAGTKTVWRAMSIPEALFQTVKRLIVYTGDPSVAERGVTVEAVAFPQDTDRIG